MKLADRVIETHSAGIRNASGFTIAQTSKMFKILSDSLYSDKIMAVIRELSTNAYDSHISAGNKNPFKVILPNTVNPNFVIRDYGTGLSQEDMEHLYTTYGASNKNDSNDFVGCLGLGSKSPFAYTKSFTTCSYYNGKKYSYVAAIDDNGVPTLNLFATTDTNEPNGLEISFAVKQYDYAEFTTKSIRIFHFFKMKPIIEGGVPTNGYTTQNLHQHDYANKNIVISGDGWRVCQYNTKQGLFPSVYHKIESGIIAIMGNIAYPVQASQITGEEKVQQTNTNIQRWNRAFGKSDINSWKNFVEEVLNQNLYLELDFDIGELEMDVSREGLQYTKDVVSTLKNRTQDIYLQMKEEFSKKLNNAKTKIEAIATYYDMNNLAGGWAVGAEWTDSAGKKHTIDSGEDIEYKLEDNKLLYVFNYRSSGYRSRRLVYLTNKIHYATLTGAGEYYWNSVRKTGQITFFVCDVKSQESAKKIVTRYCNNNDCFAYLLVDSKDHNKSFEGFDQLIADVGKDNFLKVSDYKHLMQNNSPRKSYTRNSNGAVSDQDVFFVYGASKDSTKIENEYNDAAYLSVLSSSELEDFIDSDEIIYVPISRYKSVTDPTSGNNKTPEISEIHDFIWNILGPTYHKEFFQNKKIYAIKDSFLKKLIKNGYNLIHWNDFFKEQFENFVDKNLQNVDAYKKLVRFCEKEYSETNNGGDSYYYRYGDIVHQFSFHILNIFGLDYHKYINNTSMVEAVDYYLIMEFFADTAHRQEINISKFKSDEYFSKINSIMSKLNWDNFNSKTIRDKNILYTKIMAGINKLYGPDYIFPSIKNDHINVTLCKKSEIRTKLKMSIDTNPMMKYIMGIAPTRGDIRLLRQDNPIRNIVDNVDGQAWSSKIEDSNLDLLKIQLSSLIK
jgi:hypothetical protein